MSNTDFEEKKPAIASSDNYAAGHSQHLKEGDSYLHCGYTLVEELMSEIKRCLDPGARVLEVGCGGGHTAARLAQLGFDVTAIDFSDVAIQTASASYEGVKFLVADADQLDFSAESFDAVVAVEFIEHLGDPRSHVKEAHRVLRQAGYYFVKTPNKSAHNLFYRSNPEVERWHPSVMTVPDLKGLLAEVGFSARFIKLERIPEYQLKKLHERLGRLARIGASLLRSVPLRKLPLGWQPSIICVAQKRLD